MKIRVEVANTSIMKSKMAFCRVIKPSEIGLLPKTLQYFVILSNSTSFLSILASTISFKISPASKPRNPINTAFITRSHEKLP